MSPAKSAKTLAEILANLPDEERIILTMHLLRNLSPAQIAESIGVPERAVLSLISSGKARLSAQLGI
jgi:DNA-directed RNA polymerase specialized sigma24 family protein